MFSKRSRYYRLDDTTFSDHAGIDRQCKALRRTLAVAGQFLHTLEASDRLDHLAYKYHRQSLHWWRICDANPEFSDPLALLGQTPITTVQLELIWDSGTLPLAELYRELARLPGVKEIIKGANNGLPEIDINDSAAMFTLPGSLQSELNSAVLSQSLPVALDTALQAEGLILPATLRVTKPQEGLWQIELTAGSTLYRLRYSGDTALITVNEGLRLYRITLAAAYNRNSINQQQIVALITSIGFDVAAVEEQTRIGQRIVIPPRYTGKD
jgi:hypothetical protein